MRRHFNVVLACLACGLLLAAQSMFSGRGSIAVTNAATFAGFSNPSFPSLGTLSPPFSPTGEKPQSKLWYNDGRWWAGMLYSDKKYYIYWLDRSGQPPQWVKTTTELDPRGQTQADYLWDGAHLYVASGGDLNTTGAALDGHLYRYSYDPALKTYTRDLGPVTIRSGGAETIVLDKDSTGQLWITYTQHDTDGRMKVWINRSTISDSVWGTPFNPPMPSDLANGAIVDPDDISSLVAFDGKVGVLWSNQLDSTFYFAVHGDANPDTTWTSGIARRQSNIADDHLNLKSVRTDSGGNLFAVVKTSISGTSASDPRIMVLWRTPAGAWSYATVFDETGEETRPVLLIDSANHRLYVFATTTTNGGAIAYKQSTDYTAGPLSFPSAAVNFIKIDLLNAMNNATSTKQNVDGTSDIVVLASDGASRVYGYNVLDLPSPAATATATPTSTPTNTPTAIPSPTPPPWLHAYLPLLLR